MTTPLENIVEAAKDIGESCAHITEIAVELRVVAPVHADQLMALARAVAERIPGILFNVGGVMAEAVQVTEQRLKSTAEEYEVDDDGYDAWSREVDATFGR